MDQPHPEEGKLEICLDPGGLRLLPDPECDRHRCSVCEHQTQDGQQVEVDQPRHADSLSNLSPSSATRSAASRRGRTWTERPGRLGSLDPYGHRPVRVSINAKSSG